MSLRQRYKTICISTLLACARSLQHRLKIVKLCGSAAGKPE